MLTAMISGRGWHSQFFCLGPIIGLALAPKMCPDQSQAFKEFNTSKAFAVGRKKLPRFVSGRAASRCSKACLYEVSRNYSKNWLRRTNIKPNLTSTIDYTLKPSNYDAMMPSRDLRTLPHKVQMSTPFLRNRSWNFAHVFNVPMPSLTNAFVFFLVFFSPGNVGSLNTQI